MNSKQPIKKQLSRKSITDNVERMIHCNTFDKENGYLYFECKNEICNNFHLQPFTCKCRLCPTCGKKYHDARVKEVCKKCINVSHRHITFTLSDKLRYYSLADRSLLDCLFESVEDVFSYMALKVSKRKGYKFDYISSLHTFGRDLKFNPHIHVLIAECMIDKDNNVRDFKHFNYEFMRKSFQKSSLDRMTQRIDSADFRKLKKEIYKVNTNGFYVHGPEHENNNLKSKKDIVSYIVRYAGHPAIGESRIIRIDYKNNLITWFYVPHEDSDGHTAEKKGRKLQSQSLAL